ncbi:hypothetical protein PV350_14505 [Streptomyces sp. PA03-6a]|nr:hypothetical protein [Streptomyces sp. PA03-6a]
MNTTAKKTRKAAQAAPVEPTQCERNGWCVSGYKHPFTCSGQQVSMDSTTEQTYAGTNELYQILNGQITLDGDDNRTPQIAFDGGGDEWVTFSPDQLRGFVAKVRAHLPRLEALADQFEAITAPDGRHYSWCDHHATEDGTTEHIGPESIVPVPDGMDVRGGGLLSAYIVLDDNWTAAKPALSFNSGGNGVLLDGQQADKVIADLEQFVANMKALRAQMDEEPVA